MKTVLQRSGTYIKTRDALSWFLVIAGSVLLALLTESIRLHREVGPQGGHHGDVAGGFLLLDFLFRMTPFVLASAGVVALFGRSIAPLAGAISGLLASGPMLLVLGVLGALPGCVLPFLGALFPFVVGIALVITGLLKKARMIKPCADAS